AESTQYTAAFTVEDGVIVKAIAIGDNESYINSDIASKRAILEGATIAAPVIKQFNGTVAITCETAGTTIEYSLDGENYTTYSRAFTLTENGTVYARAKRGDKTSESVSAKVTTISKGDANKTIWMGFGSFTVDGTNKYIMTGSTGDDAEGIVLTIDNTDKSWSSAEKITIGDNERTSIKVSNGAKNIMTLPEGMSATRITFYSYINSAEGRTSYWAEFNGAVINGDVPMGAWNTVTDRLTNPDVRVFPLNGESEITFTNTGEQLCFIIALDVIEAEDPVLNVSAEELTFKTSPYSKTSTAAVKLTGSYLTDGDYTVELPSISGLSIEPTSFTVTDGAVSQDFTLTYAPETGENTSANLSFVTPGATAEVSLVFENRAEAYEQAVVSEAATWNWKVLSATVELSATTTPSTNDEFVLAELEDNIEFVESFGDPKAIVMKGMQFPSRDKKAQGNGVIKIKTSVAGTIQVVYSNTGSNNNNRWPTINGQTFGDEAVGTAETTANTPVLPAGEIEIGSTGALRWYSITFTPADAPTITATITEAGYATFSSLFEVEIPSGVEAYYASASDGETVTMTSIDGGVIPAGTGVVLKGAEGSYTMAVSNTGATLDGTNLLKANIANREPDEAEYYTLAAGPKFCKSTGGTLAAGKAYLVIPSGSSARIVTMTFDGEATGISELKSVAEEGALYNLSGARVSKPTKGLYIQNGKKLMVK
ncbi:MAG: chitobiase/beta-hexosaminidase C-terminal domain-containing protein, partial [Prevotella sp.]|nr:chitobiase/beta-hexosaminidase C-terminal domain-containing protein [Prevotella sp.]